MPFTREIGNVSTTEKECLAEVEWRIQDFSFLSHEDGACYWSPPFSMAGLKWDFWILPNARISENSYGFIQLLLGKLSSRPCPDMLHFSVSLRHMNGHKECETKDQRCFKSSRDSHVLPPLISRSELWRRRCELLPSDVLTVVCTVDWGSSATSDCVTPTAECCHCKKSFDTYNLLSHQRKCAYRPVICPDCFEAVPLRKFFFEDHECQKANAPDVVKKISLAEIRRATQNFSHELGSGSFGNVYKGEMDDGGVTVQIAVKKLKEFDKQFEAELDTLCSFKHEFLLSVIGYCDDPIYPCLVLEYMPNGSLEDRLACKENVQPLSWHVRLVIAYCSALGINHLHSLSIVHRDIKSANILLDKDLFPKVADFGLVRIGESGESTIVQVTKNVCGTLAYMAPDAYHGDVSSKLDTFSFGVVLLELLTGLPSKHGGKYLFLYENRLMNMLDDKAQWDRSIAEKLYKISKRCLIREKSDRPTISQILTDLRATLPADVWMLIMKHHSCP